MIVAKSIPSFAEENIGPAVSRILKRADIRMDEVDRFICHPGGTKVVAALEKALEIAPGALDHERDVLRDYGNMSAPTVLFVLDHALRAGLAPRSVMMARRSLLFRAEFDTLRSRLIKNAARVVEGATRIRIWLPSACPDAALCRHLAGRFAAAGP